MTPEELAEAVLAAARPVVARAGLLADLPAATSVEPAADPRYGDYTSTLAMRVASRAGIAARPLAEAIAEQLAGLPELDDVTVAGRGFINVRVATRALAELAGVLVSEPERYVAPARLPQPPEQRFQLAGGGEPAGGDELAGGGEPAGGDDLVGGDQLAEVLGPDAARYALARYAGRGQVRLDVDRWSRHREGNPAFEVRYAHARAASLLRNAADLGIDRGDRYDPGQLAGPPERELLLALADLPAAVRRREPARVARQLERIAAGYRRFEERCRVLPRGDEPVSELTRARLWLVAAARIGLRTGLRQLGVSAPDRL